MKKTLLTLLAIMSLALFLNCDYDLSSVTDQFSEDDADSASRGASTSDENSEGRPGRPPFPFEVADTNADANISLDEWSVFHRTLFTEIDTDANSSLTETEMKAHHDAKMAENCDDTKSKRGEKGKGKGKGKGEKKPPKDNFADKDTDANGEISLEEWNNMHNTMFTEIDANADGLVTKTELEEHKPPKPADAE